jgi:hypothetical protein
MPEGVLFRRLLIAVAIVALCLGPAASFAAAAPVPGENGTSGGSPATGEKPVTAKLPVTPAESREPAEKSITARPADLAATPEVTAPAPPEVINSTLSPAAPTSPGPTASVLATTNETGDEEEPVPTLEDLNTTASPEPTASVLATTDDAGDEDEPEETPVPVPTLEREAPPRPNATMARSHQSHDRPLAQGDHQLVRPASPFTPRENETGAPPEVAAPREGLFVRGVGVLLSRTPADVALTRSGMEIANLDWLLDGAMRLGGRHPRVAMEGETFTVTVTVEARNLTLTEGEPAYVVLVPPPGEIAVYEITRTKEPRSLRAGERGVWEFSVATRTGRLTLENLTLPEERLVTNLTSYPDAFAFRAYALAGSQEIPSSGLSDPVLAVRPGGSTNATVESPLPALYALVGVQDSLLRPSETMTDAWRRGVDYDAITAGAGEHLDAFGSLGKEEVAAVYASEGKAGGAAAAGSPSSPFDLIAGFFRGIFEWFGGTAG